MSAVISLILFIAFMTLTPFLLIKYIEKRNDTKTASRLRNYALVTFLCAVLCEIPGSLYGALGLLVVGIVVWVMVFLCSFLRKKVIKSKNCQYISDFTVGLYKTAILFLFYVLTSAGVMSHLCDGIFEVVFTYELTQNNSLLVFWWLPSVLFAVLQMFFHISKDVGSFGKKLIGALVFYSLVFMVTGDFCAVFLKGSITVVIDVIWDVIGGNGYPDVVSGSLYIIMAMLECYTICLAAGYVVAFFITSIWAYRQKYVAEKNILKVSVDEMRRADAYTINSGVPSTELMYRAAEGIYNAVNWKNKKVAVVSGSGNNGGDGYALATILSDNNIHVTIFRTSERFSVDGKFFFEQAKAKGINDEILTKDTNLSEFDIVVDCILGTGFKGTPQGAVAEGINAINNSGAYVVSADINSGLDGDNGKAILAVKSDITVSIGFYKKGMFCKGAKQYIGELTNVDIGIVLV